MSSSDRYSTGPDDLVTAIQDLQRRLNILETSPRLTNSAIDSNGLDVREGNIRILDASGNIRIQMGKLADGSYDIAAFNASGTQTVNLAALAFGATGAIDSSPVTSLVNFGAYDNPLTGTAGPSVSVLIGESGRCKVHISCLMDYTVLQPPISGGQLNMTYYVSGATTISSGGDTRAVGEYTFLGSGAANITLHRVIRVGRTNYHSGLNPGITTFQLQYAADIDVGSAMTHNFMDRSIIVEPF